MKIPYNQVHASGTTLFAARGGKLLSFSLADGTHIATWQHPDLENSSAATEAAARLKDSDDQIDEQQPPAKRQRLDTEIETETGDAEEVVASSGAQEGGEVVNAEPGKGNEKAKAKKNKRRQRGTGHDGGKSQDSRMARAPDRPVITHLESTEDGRYMVVVTAHDKTIWTFEHDGNGKLAVLNKRAMPKRPSAILISPDLQIICADKFGDVYSLPLIPDESNAAAGGSTTTVPHRGVKPGFTPSANTFTVHSKRNLQALEHQRKQMERDQQQKAKLGETASGQEEDGAAAVPDFEMSLLLGHVSMLTALTLAESDGRRYIITGDRDEHIRISRYTPQAHVIEGYCFGHKDFVNSLLVPAGRPEILVSGGGDPELFVWDWKNGNVRTNMDLLSLAQKIAPETNKVAVSGLYSLQYPHDGEEMTFVLAICESIKAIFSWQLTDDGILNHPAITQLPGNPLDVTVASGLPSSSSTEEASAKSLPPKIVVAVDSGEEVKAKSIHVFALTLGEGRLSVDTDSTVRDDDLEKDEPEITAKEVRDLLYVVENLRKQPPKSDEQGDDAAGTERAEEGQTAPAEEQEN